MWYKLALRSLIALLGIVAVTTAADWNTSYDYLEDNDGKDSAVATTVDPEGNIYVLATCTNGADPPNLDVVVLKYSQTGELDDCVWSCDLGDDEEAVAFVRDELHGCLYVAAEASGTYLTIKFEDDNPDTVWTRLLTTPGSGTGGPVGIALSPQGDWVVVTGTRIGGILDEEDIFTVMYDASGNHGSPAWEWRFNWTTNREVSNKGDFASAILVDAAGNFWVAGSTENFLLGYDDYGLDFRLFADLCGRN